ncbi:serine hydrolase domain-containing protein [Azospirillum sp. SYSU D00513]|uniref:serine hydrolase domain-containing protein n=1 Tax=Azospirillum sp. SYSU D00513 TaxID=2812561 RepID=UPI001A965C5D|nr:serine hydrolase domain-containing protein [Azospirillum sp. SYSU D00513]
MLSSLFHGISGSRLLLAAAAFLTALAGSPAALRADPYRTLLDRFLAEEELPGGVLLVSGPGTRSVAAAGVADRRTRAPVTPGTRFYVASVGKMAVAAAVLQMVEEGKLALDAPVAALASGIPGIGRLANARSARLSQLLDHSSGIPDYLTDGFTETSRGDPRRRWTPADALSFALGEPATGKPGAAYEYCNSNFVLLGHIAEAADGAPLEEVLRRRVFARAGMDGSTVGARPDDPRLAHGYADIEDSGREKDVSLLSWNSPLGDGPLVTTAEDLERFLFALFRDGRLLGQQGLRRMSAPSALEPGYGMGLELGKDRWGRWAGHTGSYDGFEAEARYYPDRRTAIVFLTNGNQASDSSILDRAAATLFGKR